jgi:predicted TIM-barrel fold metal-dependent hydrolase
MQTPWGECPAVDAHIHFFSRRFFEVLASQAGKTVDAVAAELGWELPPADPTELARRWAAELDSQGVERAAMIASVPGDAISVRAAAAACPSRFLAYAMVNPLADSPTVVEGLDAVCFFPAMHQYFIHDPKVEPFFEEAAARGTLVFVHCGVLTVAARTKLGLPSPFELRFSNPIELHGVALRHPRVRFIVPHFGAGYFREALMLAELCPNVYLDTSSSNSWMRFERLDLQTVFRWALDVAGPTRLLFGTDSSFFPRGWNQDIFAAQAHALKELGVSAGDARLIFGENLKRLRSGAS